MTDLSSVVFTCASEAKAAMSSLAAADNDTINLVLREMAKRLAGATNAIAEANQQDIIASEKGGMPAAMVDRLRLDPHRITGMADQLAQLADVPFPAESRELRRLPSGHVVTERRRPVGVIGAIYEARPNVTVDVASQLIKSRNAGVLRTGGAALRSASVLVEEVITPSLRAANIDQRAVQLVPTPDREASIALVSQPNLVPLVIVRGSGDTTRLLAAQAAQHGVRVLAHADGGGVLYVDRDADPDETEEIIEQSLDRLGVCNRLNLLLVHRDVWDDLSPRILDVMDRLALTAALPPHSYPRGHEWALDEGREDTVTIDFVSSPEEAVTIANEETSGLAAGIISRNSEAAARFLDTYRGTGAFWNTTIRLLDGFKLLNIPETGINIDKVPGPRGPVTFQDLYLRQFVVIPPGIIHP